MQKDLLIDYHELDNNNLNLTGAVPGVCARCLGRGKCPSPFQNVIGYHFEGVNDNIIADNDIKKEWKIERILDTCTDAYLLTNYKSGEEVIFNNRDGQFFGELVTSDNRIAKCFINSADYQRLGISRNAIDRMIRVEKLHQSLSYVGLTYLAKMLKNNMLLDCNLTVHDVEL